MKSDGLFSVYVVKAVRIENKFTRTLIFDQALTDAHPGQFVMAWLPGVGEKPFSISGDDPLALTIADVGAVSHALNKLVVGDRVWIRGPLGKGFRLSSHSHLLVGGGYGAAPLWLLASQARQKGHPVAVALGAKSKDQLILVSAFEALGCHVYVATEDGSAGIRGLVTEAVEPVCADLHPEVLYACGPIGMLMAAAEFARNRNMPAQLSFEALIRCGVGLCGSCELSEETCAKLGIPAGFLVCHDGPVAFIP